MRKLFLLAIILIVLIAFTVSCNTIDTQAKIAEIEEKINELEKEKDKSKTESVQKPVPTEETKEEEPTVETSEEKTEKEFSPNIVGSLSIPGFTTNVYVMGKYAYTSGEGLNIIDISDKTNPIMTSNSSTTVWTNNLYADGDYAYLPYMIWDDESNPIGGGLQIIDVTKKNNPIVVGTFESEAAIMDIFLIENYIYAPYEIYELGEEYLETVDSGIKIIDIADKKNPVSVGTYEAGSLGISTIFIVGDYAYTFSGGEFKILDITDRENPTDKSSYLFSNWAPDIYVAEDYAYLPFDNSLQIIDVTDKENPTIVGGAFAPGDIGYVFVEGDYAYITYVVRDGDWQVKESGMQIIDVKDKNTPVVIAEVKIPGEAKGIYIMGDYAYVGAGLEGLQILELYAD